MPLPQFPTDLKHLSLPKEEPKVESVLSQTDADLIEKGTPYILMFKMPENGRLRYTFTNISESDIIDIMASMSAHIARRLKDKGI